MKNEYNERDGVAAGLIVCDLDHLKYVNDCFGHQQGDAYMVLAANLLKEIVDNCSIVTRIGGDEFVILLENTSEEQLIQKVGKLMEAFELKKHEFSIDMDFFIGSEV